jgi:hypothetical protein
MAASVEGGSWCISSRLRNLLALESWLLRRAFQVVRCGRDGCCGWREVYACDFAGDLEGGVGVGGESAKRVELGRWLVMWIIGLEKGSMGQSERWKSLSEMWE